MLQTRHDQIALTIQCWRRASQALARESGSALDQDEPLVRAIHDHLLIHDSMSSLLLAFERDGGAWPQGITRPPHLLPQRGEELVAAAYWQRYQELLSHASHSITPDESDARNPRDASRPALGPQLGRIELQYTVKLWQRGPLWLRALPPERRARVERIVGRIYSRIANARSVNALASQYYADGEWILALARDTLSATGEPASSASLAQDVAFWQRYQELLTAANAGQWRSRDAEAQTAAFAAWLAQHMSDQKLSVASLAHRLGVTEGAVRGWLQGRDQPPADVTSRLASAIIGGTRPATAG